MVIPIKRKNSQSAQKKCRCQQKKGILLRATCDTQKCIDTTHNPQTSKQPANNKSSSSAERASPLSLNDELHTRRLCRLPWRRSAALGSHSHLHHSLGQGCQRHIGADQLQAALRGTPRAQTTTATTTTTRYTVHIDLASNTNTNTYTNAVPG